MIYLMVGLPAAGKSTEAEKLSKQLGGIPILGADQIRQNLFGDAAIQGDPKFIYAELYRQIDEAISLGKDIIIDNTNLYRWSRADYLAKGVPVVCVYVKTPLDICLQRNRTRDRKVPEAKIHKMAESFEEPSMEEGFKEIRVVKNY